MASSKKEEDSSITNSSCQEEMHNLIGLLEEKLSKLRLDEERPHIKGETPLVVGQNELRTAFKGIGVFLGTQIQENILQEELHRIYDILRQPLRHPTNSTQSVKDNEISGTLSYLKLLAEACPVQCQYNQQQEERLACEDVFWKDVIVPIYTDILDFFHLHIFDKCLSELSSASCKTTANGSESGTSDTLSNHATGFAFHYQLGILMKGIRIYLIFLKRSTANLEIEGKTEIGDNDVSIRIEEIMRVLCSLMSPSKKAGLGRDFDVGLDIRCNIGIAICYSIYCLRNNESQIQAFFELIFKDTKNSALLLSDAEKDVLSLTESDVNRIAVAFGILNTWLDKHDDPELYFSVAKNILDIQHGVKEAVNLGSSRVLEIWTDKLTRPIVPMKSLERLSSLFPPLEFFCFMYMPGHIDAVKNCCRNIISLLSQIYDRLDEEKVPFSTRSSIVEGETWVQNLLRTVLETPVHIKWIALACIAKKTKKALKALELNPSLPGELLTAQRTFKGAANDTYVALMSYHFETAPELIWEQTWIEPLFTVQLCQKNESNWNQKKNIISMILNSDKLHLTELQVMILPLLKNVLKRINDNGFSRNNKIDSGEEECSLPEASMLAAETIKMAYELKITVQPQQLSVSNKQESSTDIEESFRGLVPRSILNGWLWSENRQIRLAGFALLVETKKTSEYITEQDFVSLQIFLKYNLLSQNPAFRQQFFSYFKKLVRRLKDGESISRRKKDSVVRLRYIEFMEWLWKFLTIDEGLFEGANFGRRCQALECLAELVHNFNGELEYFGVDNLSSVKLISSLTDSYENNKIQALEILVRLPIKEFDDENFSKSLFDEALNLCKSIKPPESVTGRYLMTLLMRKSNDSKYSALNILEALYSELEDLFSKINFTSLIQVSCETPLYGCFGCIRKILQSTTEYNGKEQAVKYRNYVEKLLKLCLKINEVLFPVLGSAAPEGFLPGLQDSAPEDNKQVVRSLAAQMLLVCAWRTMKEICLLMSDMCTAFKMEGETNTHQSIEYYILTYQQVSLIGDHLLYLLKNLMHRGVFEQVFVGFKQISNRLWRSSSQALSRLPEKWLQEAMDQEHISAKSITRRSAGLPFIFQALLSAESDNEHFLQHWVQRLLIYDESPELTPIRIHSMNVLRGLFRDASFSAALMPFVPHGLKLAFRGLKSLDWTERNSGLMLFGAIMRRSFGPKLNLMNAPTFFRKFPQMYDFLLEELDTSINLIQRRISERSLHKETEKDDSRTCDFTFHLLLLLSSFTPSGRVEDTHFKLAEFIPKIRKCGESDDIEVRKLAAKALIPFLVSPEEKTNLLMAVLEDIRLRIGDISHNKLHGLLLQILAISSHLEQNRVAPNTTSTSKVINSFLTFVNLQSTIKSLKAPTVLETLMEIFGVFYSLNCEEKAIVYKQGILLTLKTYHGRFPETIPWRQVVPGLPVADKTIANVVLRSSLVELQPVQFLEMVYEHFRRNSLISKSYISEFLELFQDERMDNFLFKISGNVSEDDVIVFIEAVITNYLERVQTEFSKFPATDTELNYMRFFRKIPSSLLENLESDLVHKLLERLFENSESKEGGKETTTLQIKSVSFMVLGKVAFSTNIGIQDVMRTKLCDTLLSWSASEMDVDLREAAAESLPKSFQNTMKLSELDQAKIWSSTFLLAQDDEGYLREIIHQKLASTVTGGKPCCGRKSLELLTETYISNFLAQHPTVGTLLLLGLLLREDFEVEASAADDENEDRLFDKSEMNMYFEHITLSKCIKKELEVFLNKCPAKVIENIQSCLNSELTENQKDFYRFVSNKYDPTSFKPCSIREIVVQESKIDSCDSSKKRVVDKNILQEVIRTNRNEIVKHNIRKTLFEILQILK